MGGSRNQVNKAHKTRFSSKSSRNLHKTSGSVYSAFFLFLLCALFDSDWDYDSSVVAVSDKGRIGKSEHNVAKGARAARIQRNKMVT